MRRKSKVHIGLVVLALGTLPSLALADGPAIGEPTVGGSGCPAGTVSSSFAPDHTVLTIFFDDYIAETEEKQKKAVASCLIGLPMDVPTGHRVTGVSVDFRGYAYVPKGGKGRFRAKYKINGKGAGNHQTKFASNFDDDFIATHAFTHPPQSNKFKCGESVNLSIDTELWVQKKKPKQDDEAYAALDSADIVPGIQVVLNTHPCN